jgi:hypothetical protein
MFWRPKNEEARIPGLTGTGRFIFNMDWWLWDDIASPGLISIDRFEELRRAALSPDEHKKLTMVLVADSVTDVRRRRNPQNNDPDFAQYALEKVSNLLVEVRQEDFEHLSHWLGSNYMAHDDGWVRDQNGTRINRDILRVVSAYINCLELWGFQYGWSSVQDSAAGPALLIHKKGEPRFCLSRREVLYVQGKPYRFSIAMRRATWHFDTSEQVFQIGPREGELINF